MQVGPSEFSFLQELHWSQLQAVMTVVLQVLLQVQAQHVSQVCVCMFCVCVSVCACLRKSEICEIFDADVVHA